MVSDRMNELRLHRREPHPDIEYLDEPDDLHSLLEHTAPHIGRIIIEFNSLEDSIAFCIKELVSESESRDDQVFVFLAEMKYSAKVTALVNLYGQYNEQLSLNLSSLLADIEQRLRDAANIRNQYAHASWSDFSKSKFVRTRAKATKSGVFYTYRQFNDSQMESDLMKIRNAHAALEFIDYDFHEKIQTKR